MIIGISINAFTKPISQVYNVERYVQLDEV